ncbi:hypothetical protein AAFC00_006765 [Neodothiora populina]|uniref:AAA+ ATPase domain-containing protein n=1 Tax=Neodothiora populina TaxID=2781224 RepID=A0ABR3PBR2_9PEZI
MGDPPTFTVRPLIPSATVLEGAFRVHIPTKDLEILGLKAGDLCQINSADGPAGVGIAWRSTEQNAKPQIHPVKLTDTLRDAFSLKLGNHVNIQKAASQKIVHANRVIVIDVTDSSAIEATKDDNNWKLRCAFTLGNVEAISAGVAFEVASRKGLKKRFLIEHIDSDAKGRNALCFFDDSSDLVLQDEPSVPSTPFVMPSSLAITSEGIGGLNKQFEQLNKRLSRLIGQIRGKKLPPQVQRNGGILLYGPAGTGKSLLLNRIAQAQWNKVITIDQSVLGATASKNAQALRGLFDEAIARQPSLVIMDNLEAIAGGNQRDSYGTLTSILVSEMDKLKNTQVLIIGATHSPNDIDKSLRTPGRFRYEIEVPIPDRSARVEIIKAMHGTTAEEDAIAEIVGERTHGFVGQDLEALYNHALEIAVDRYFEQPSENHDSSADSTGDALGTEEATDEETVADIHTTLDEYEKALLEVRPTAMKEVFLEKPNVQWSDIGGSTSTKQILDEVVNWPLKYPQIMRQLNVEAQKGILFYGPPGCSKTLTAKAIATSSGLNFIAVKGAELTSMYVGESERAVREVFRKARAAAPSIIFFDEIDSIGSERDSAGTKGLNVLTTLLNEMDGIESLKGVLVLAATNKPEILDPALLRPGRFDSLIYVAPPNEAARKEILRIRTRSVPLAEGVDIDAIARETEGYSGAELVEICLEAARSTMRRRVAALGSNAPAEEVVAVDDEALKISNDDFEAALSKAVRRITPDMVEGYEIWKQGLSKKA